MKPAYHYDKLKNFDDFTKSLAVLRKDCFFKIKVKIPTDEENARTKKILKWVTLKTGTDLKNVFLKIKYNCFRRCFSNF